MNIRWPVVRLGDVMEIQLGKMLSPAAKTGLSSRLYVRNANVQWNRLDLTDLAEMDFDDEERRKFRLFAGDLLVCEGGEPGRAAVWDGRIEECYYQKALHRLRPRDGAVDPQFVLFRLWLGSHVGEFTGSHGKTTIAHLPAVRLAELQLPLPPLAEQRRIAARLTEQLAAVERARRATEEREEAARRLSAALLEQSLQQMGTIWDWRPLGDVLASPLRTGVSRPGSPTSSHRCLTLSSVRGGALDLSCSKPIDLDESEVQASAVVPGAFYVVRGNGNIALVGRGGIAPSEVERGLVFPDLLIEVRPNQHAIRGAFLRLVWDCSRIRHDIEARARTSAGIHKINLRNLSKVRVPCPSIDEQLRFEALLRPMLQTAATAYESTEAELAAIEALPAALLREAFAWTQGNDDTSEPGVK